MGERADAIMPPMKVSELGEFGLIGLIQARVSRDRSPEDTAWQTVLVGPGDDAAAWQGNSGIQLATTDTLVQGVHFDLSIITWEDLGRKALAVNLSDIAAMGGVPQYALVSLALPGEVEVESITRFTGAMADLAAESGTAIVGGNLAASPTVVITVTVIGRSAGKTILRRSTALPGDRIAVTGYLGSSAAGLEMLKSGIAFDPATSKILRQAHLRPVSRLREGQILAEQGVRTAIDISDGLVADLDHICTQSEVSARIRTQDLPVHPAVRANFANHADLALFGGEDYELLFTADEAIVARVTLALDCPVTVIGDITTREKATRVTVLDAKGNPVVYRKGGWEHFRNGVSKTGFA
jgi:thiamine-monophosphate kinase